MSVKIETASREQIAMFLPEAIRKTLTSYKQFMETEKAGIDAKEFKDHHTACRVAIAHIELLLKLARWADLPDAVTQDQNNKIVLLAALNEAEKELKEYEDIAVDYEVEHE